MPPYRKNVENIPLREFNKAPMPIMVFVIDLKNDDNIVQQVQLDYSNFEDRKALGALSYWAYSNHCSIETIAIVDAEAEIKEENEND